MRGGWRGESDALRSPGPRLRRPMTSTVHLEGRIRRSLAWSSVNSIVLRLGQFLVGVVLARLIAPAQFGLFAVALAVQGILVTIAELGISADLVRTGDIRHRAPTVATIGLVSSALITLSMVAMAGPLATAFGAPGAERVIQVLSVTILLSGVAVVPYALIQREFQQGRQLVADLVSFVISTVGAIGLALAGQGAMSLAWSRLLGQGVATLLLFWFTRTVPRYGFDRVVARQVVTFGAPLAAANLLSGLLMNVDYIVVGRSLGAVQLGFYLLAFNISLWPTSVLGQAVRSVALPGFSRLLGDRDRLSRTFSAAAALTLAAALFVGVQLATLAVPLIRFVYGERWGSSAHALAGLGLFGALRVVFELAAGLLVAVGMTRRLLWIQVLWLVSLTPLMIVFVGRWSLRGAGLAHLVAAAVVILPVYLIALRAAGIHLHDLVSRAAAPVLACFPLAAVGLLMPHAVGSPFVTLAASGLAGAAVYLLLLTRWLRRQLAAVRGGDQAATPLRQAHLGERSVLADGLGAPQPAAPGGEA